MNYNTETTKLYIAMSYGYAARRVLAVDCDISDSQAEVYASSCRKAEFVSGGTFHALFKQQFL